MSVDPDLYAKGPEALVVSLAASGDRNAFAGLVRRRQSWIRNLMRRCCGDVTLADDLSQQIFMQAWRKIRQLKNPDSFDSWLKRLAVNTWLQHQRKNDALTDADTHLETDFSQAEQHLGDDGFSDAVMTGIQRRRRRLIAGRIAIAAAVIGFEIALSFPLQNSVGWLTRALSAPLLELGDHWLVVMLAPLNSIGGLIGMGLIGLQLLLRKLVR